MELNALSGRYFIWQIDPVTFLNPDPVQLERFSAKASFMVKIKSIVIDYSLSFPLLQFFFDRWIFKTVTGGVNVT